VSRRASNDWPMVLAFAREIVTDAVETPTLPQLWDQLVATGICDGSDRQWSGFRHQLREATLRGDFPALPKAKTGPARGSQWSDDRHAATEPSPWETVHDRRGSCHRYLSAAVQEDGYVELTPSVFAVMAEQGWGEHIVFWAVARLREMGEVSVQRVNVLRAGYTLALRRLEPSADQLHGGRARRQSHRPDRRRDRAGDEDALAAAAPAA
jgi:hypothetical protein